MTEDAIRAELHALGKRMDDGFNRVSKDLDELKSDNKALNKEGLPRRVGMLERWRDALSGRVWRLLIGVTVAVIAAWVPFLLQIGDVT